MQVTHISIRNILGIESLDIEAGKFIAVTGRNGTGKTSVVEAVKAALGGGHDATLLRNGAARGEVVLVLDDGSKITKKVTADKSEQLFTDGEGRKIARPAESIRQLIDALSVNPVEFLTVQKKQQVTALLEAMPMTVNQAKLTELVGDAIGTIASPKLAEMHAMDAIEVVRRHIYDERTGINRAAKEKASTAKQLAESLPPEVDVSESEEEILRADLTDLDKAQADALAKADAKMDEIREAHEAAVAEVRREIAELEAKITEANEGLSAAKTKVSERKAEINSRAAVKRAEINGKLDAINNSREARARAAQARETATSMQAEAERLQEQADVLTGALERLEEYKAELLEKLPIPGLEVRGGDIFFNGVPFERLNSAEQVKVAVELAKLRAGKLGLVCVDGIERLDGEAFEAFRQAAIDSGVQMVVTRVGDSPFSVESIS